MIKYVKGNIFESHVELLAHGANCKGGFGSGVAGQMAKIHPQVKYHYLHKHQSEGWKLGDVQFVFSGNRIIANCATQNDYVPRGQVHADYDAIKICMEKVKDFAKKKDVSVAVPKIGAGLAGGDWNVIEKILNDVFLDYDIAVYHLE